MTNIFGEYFHFAYFEINDSKLKIKYMHKFACILR